MKGFEAPAALAGRWRASGLREGLDLLNGRGRLCYYPVGRGGAAFLPDGVFRLTTLNGAGMIEREGCWEARDGRLSIRMDGGLAVYRWQAGDGRLLLTPEHAFYRCAARLLHSPQMSREDA